VHQGPRFQPRTTQIWCFS